MVDLTPVGTTMSQAFTALGNMMLIIGGACLFVAIVLIGFGFLGGVVNQRSAEFAKGKVLYVVIATAVFGGAGAMARILAATAAQGRM